jgi:hypothetical protein
MWIVSVGFDVTDQLLIGILALVRYRRKNGSTMGVHQLFLDFKKACDAVSKETVYNIFTEFGVHMERIRLTEMYLNKAYIKSSYR